MFNYKKLNLSILQKETIKKIMKQPEVQEVVLFGETAFLYGYRITLDTGEKYTVYSRDFVE